jgi:hypothetical protein
VVWNAFDVVGKSGESVAPVTYTLFSESTAIAVAASFELPEAPAK